MTFALFLLRIRVVQSATGSQNGLWTSMNVPSQVSVRNEDVGTGLIRFAILSEELTFDLQLLQKQTEKELRDVRAQ